mgnify:CR=1 FL=1
MQRFNNKESKRRKAHIQYQCCMVAFFDAPGFVCAKVLGNIRRNRIPDGHENQGKDILHPHCCRISCQCLRAEGIYHCLYNHHEQASAMAAEAYARIHNRIAALCVTTGPGGTNAITGVVGGWLDSIPMLVLSGPGAL